MLWPRPGWHSGQTPAETAAYERIRVRGSSALAFAYMQPMCPMRPKTLVPLMLLAGLTACGGGAPPASPPTERPQGLGGTDVSADELMNWAERTFPQFFSPAAQPSQTSAPYVYRFYPGTQNYLGLDDDKIYVLGPVSGGALLGVGTVYGFACEIKPEACTAPAITVGPIARIAYSGRPAGFSVVVSGGPSLRYQWLRDDQPIPGANASSYAIAAVQPSDSGARFSVRVSNSKGTVTSGSATLSLRNFVELEELQSQMQSNGCSGCHDVELRVNGPAFRSVAERYNSRADAVSYLADRIRNGSFGQWGGNMPANRNVSTNDAETIASGILSLLE